MYMFSIGLAVFQMIYVKVLYSSMLLFLNMEGRIKKYMLSLGMIPDINLVTTNLSPIVFSPFWL